MNARTENDSAFLEMEFTPDWSFINDVRSFMETFCERWMVPERASAVALTVHELLQNAVDYSTDGWARLRLDIYKKEQRLNLRVESHGNPERLEGLRQMMKRIEEEPDPLQLYLTLMRETAKRKGSSGLGLARIRFEAGMDLKIDIQDGRVRVDASSSLEAPASLKDQLRAPRTSRETTHG